MSDHDTGRVTDVFEQFAHDLGLYIVARFVPAITSVVALVVFTHAFPPSSYGRYALTLSIATILGTVCYGWIEESIVRFEPHVEPSALLGNVAWFVVVIGATFAIGAVIGYVLFRSSLGAFAPFVLAGAAVAITEGIFYVLRALLRARLESKSAAVYDVAKSVGGLVCALIVAFVVVQDIVGWLWGTAIATGVAMAILGFRLGFGADSIRIDSAFARRMARYGFPLIGWLVGQTLLNFGDQALIQLLRGSEATGIYASNYSVVHYGLGLVFAPFVTAVGPVVMNIWEGDNEEELAETVADMTRYLLLVGVPTVIGISALNRVLSGLLLDESYLGGAIIIPFVAGGLLLWNVAIIGQKAIEVEERTTVLFGGIGLAVAVNLVANVPLIIWFGYVGAAIATLASFAIYAVFVYIVSQRYIPWRLPQRSIRNVGVASFGLLVPYIGVFALGWEGTGGLVAASVAGAIGYLVLIYLLGELTTNEIATLKRLLTPS